MSACLITRLGITTFDFWTPDVSHKTIKSRLNIYLMYKYKREHVFFKTRVLSGQLAQENEVLLNV